MNSLFFIAYFSTLSPLLALGLSLRLKKVSYDIRLIQLLTAFAFIIDLSCFLLGKKGVNIHPLGNLFSLFQSILLLLIFCEGFNLKRFSVYIAIAYSFAFLANYFFIQSPFIFNSYSHTISSVIFILLALLYFRYLLKELPETYALHIPMVWINLAILVYYSGNLLLFILNNYFTIELNGYEGTIWIIHNILNIAKNLLFLIAIWQSLRKTSSSSS